MTALIPLSNLVQVPAVTGPAGATVFAMCIDPSNGDIYFGGTFTTINGVSRIGCAAITRYGVLKSWNPVLSASGNITSMLFTAAGIYMGGLFTSVNGTSRTNAALVNTSGTLQGWNPVPNSVPEVIATDGTNIYLGGLFNTCYGTAVNGFAATTTAGAGTLITPLSTSITSGGTTVSGIVCLGGLIYVCGSALTQVATSLGVTATRLGACQLDPSTGYATAWNLGLTGSPALFSMTTDGTNIYLAGNFTTILSTSRPGGMAQVSGSTPTLGSWAPAASSGFAQYLFAIGGDIYWSKNTVPSSSGTNGCSNGTTTLAWNPGFAGSVGMKCAVSDPGNTTINAIWVGGGFTTVLNGRSNQDTRLGLAKVSTQTSNPTLLLY